MLTAVGRWVSEKHRHQEGGQGAADTQLAPTSWDETKNLTVFWDIVSWRFCWFQKRHFRRRSFFFHQDEGSNDIMTPRQMTYWLNATKSVIHIFTFKTHTHPHRKMASQMTGSRGSCGCFYVWKRLGRKKQPRNHKWRAQQGEVSWARYILDGSKTVWRHTKPAVGIISRWKNTEFWWRVKIFRWSVSRGWMNREKPRFTRAEVPPIILRGLMRLILH